MVKNLGELFKNCMELEDRDSFSSLMSSFLIMDSVLRINVGQESKRNIIEKFFGFGWCLRPQPKKSVPCRVDFDIVYH